MDLSTLYNLIYPSEAYTPPQQSTDVLGGLGGLLSGGINALFPSEVDDQKGKVRQATLQTPVQPQQVAPMGYGGQGGQANDVVPVPSLLSGQASQQQAQAQLAQQPVAPQPAVNPFAFAAGGVATPDLSQIGDAGAMTRAASPTGTLGYQSPDAAQAAIAQQSQPQAPNMSQQVVDKTMEAIKAAPGSTWQERVSALPADPIFQVGLALMSHVRGTSLATDMNTAIQSANKFGAYNTQQAQAKALQNFDPSKYSSLGDAYKGALAAGVAPEDALSLAGKFNPVAETAAVAAGGALVDKRTGKLLYQAPDAVTGTPKAIQQLTAARDGFPVGSPQWTTYDNAIKKMAPDASVANKPTEYQSKSAAFGARAQAADQTLQGLENSNAYSVAGQATRQALAGMPGVGALTGGIANAFTGPQGQKVDQAQRDFVNAALRLESGATITPAEFDNARKQYFPQPGDGPQVLAQKQRNRQLVIQGMQNSAGRAAFTPSGGANAGATGGGAATPTQAGAIAEMKKRGII